MKNNGFTLIELLVVIALIGILSGMVVTAIGTRTETTRNSSNSSDTVNIQKECSRNCKIICE